MEPSLILLRGLPGSGKTTLASLLCEAGKYPVHSIDSYFTDPGTGAYSFRHEDNHLAYKKCEADTRASMQASTPRIFVDNTFTIDWELEPYFKLASEFDYRLFVLTVENYHGSENVHGVSREQLEKMAGKYKVRLM